MKSICILDGDKVSNISNQIITLPGGKSPEELAFDIAQKLYENRDKDFWQHPDIQQFGYEITLFRDTIKPDIDHIYDVLQGKKENNESSHGLKREMTKKVFNRYKDFFECVYKYWIHDSKNKNDIENFFYNLKFYLRRFQYTTI